MPVILASIVPPSAEYHFAGKFSTALHFPLVTWGRARTFGPLSRIPCTGGKDNSTTPATATSGCHTWRQLPFSSRRAGVKEKLFLQRTSCVRSVLIEFFLGHTFSVRSELD